MDKTAQEIYQVLDELLANIGLQLEEFDLSFLTQAELYVEMFKVMFPTLVPLLDIDFSQEDVNDQELIQSLVDFLSKYIIKMDLDHISGELITKGDPKHILNFLQLLSEISKMIVPKEGEEEEEEGEGEEGDREEGESQQLAENYRRVRRGQFIKSAPASWRFTDQSQNSLDEWKYDKYNTVIGIPGEFDEEAVYGEDADLMHGEGDSGVDGMPAYLDSRDSRKGAYPQGKTQGQKKGKHEALRNSYSGSRISEVSKSKECSDYEMTAKKLSGVDHQFEDFDPKTDPERQKRLEGRIAAEAGWDGQYEDEEEGEEIVEEVEEEEEDERSESTAKRLSAHKHKHEQRSNQLKPSYFQEEEKYEDEEEYEQEDDNQEREHEEEVEDEEDYEGYPMRKVSKESEGYSGADYYASDPINYQSNKRASERAEEIEQEEEELEEEEEEEEEVPESQEMIQEHYEEEEEDQGTEEGHARDEIIENEAEYYRQKYGALPPQKKAKKAARPGTAKPYKPAKIEYRPLRPTTAISYASHSHSTGSAVQSAKSTKPQKTKKKVTKPKQPKMQQPIKSASSRNRISEGRISEKSRESTGQDMRGLHSAQQDSRRVTSKGSNKEENSMRRKQEQTQREQAMRYEETAKRRKVERKPSKQTTTSIRIKGETLKKAYEDQQKMLYYNIRDNKLNYLRKIHTIIYQLEKEKIKEEKEAQRSYIKSQEEATVNVLLAIKKNYQEKLDVLRQGYRNERNERKINDMAQHTFLKTLRHELRLDQMKEIERLKDRLSQEKRRFDLMTGDEAFLERKLAQLYQK